MGLRTKSCFSSAYRCRPHSADSMQKRAIAECGPIYCLRYVGSTACVQNKQAIKRLFEQQQLRSKGDCQQSHLYCNCADETGEKKIVPAATARLWVSPQGAVSPLHYDCHDSFLIQLRGTKRMLLWPAAQLKSIYPYRNWHILRRRGKVDPVKPNVKKYPKFAAAEAVEVVLNPGDVLFFPGYWAHYTESCTFSVSMTCRFGLADEVYRRKPWWSLFV